MDWNLKIAALIADIRRKAEGGFTLAEIGSIVVAFLQTAVEAASQLSNSGAEKKALVMAAAAQVFDLVWPNVPLPMLLAPFRSILTSTARGVFLKVIDGVIEAIYARLKNSLPLAPAK